VVVAGFLTYSAFSRKNGKES